MIDSFCDLLSYYEMLNMITTETFENATAINQTTEGHTMTVNVLTDLQVLLRQNLMDMCSWVGPYTSVLHVQNIVMNVIFADCCTIG